MDPLKLNKKFAKFLSYMLDRNPYEFGLVPDENGYVKIKELLKALNEEEGWKHIRRGNIDEILISLPNPPVEVEGNLIRSVNHDNLKKPVFAQTMPKELYTCIRKKAHFHTAKRGINPAGSEFVILFSDKEAALKTGRRKDKTPIMLTVLTHKAEDDGVFFYEAGETMFLARHIPPECFTGPPLPPPEDEARKKTKAKKPIPRKENPLTPGSFFPDLAEPSEKTGKKQGKRDKKSWKENKKRMRKQKANMRDNF